ncbi:MAG: hypothetical protein RIB61_12055 [Roseicyclus sp.]
MSIVFVIAFHNRYYRWRDCFNELGRCYDPNTTTVYTTSGLVWGGVSLAFACLCALTLWRQWKT